MQTKVENRLNINEKKFEITLQNNILSTDEEMKINVVEKKPAFLTNRSPLKNSEDEGRLFIDPAERKKFCQVSHSNKTERSILQLPQGPAQSDGESSSEEDVVSWLKESQRSLVAVKRYGCSISIEVQDCILQ